MSVDRLLDMFVVSKMTGMEKPLMAEFVEFQLENEPRAESGTQEPQQLADYLEEWPVAPTSTAGKVREGRIDFNFKWHRECLYFKPFSVFSVFRRVNFAFSC